ncbi:hypothetical protein MBLNU459_g6834t1 [Dothideomycetes sp. NU459]
MNSLRSFVCTSCRRAQSAAPLRIPSAARPLSTTAPRPAADPIFGALSNAQRSSSGSSTTISDLLNARPDGPPSELDRVRLSGSAADIPGHVLHVYATKHNTHITFTQPPKKDPSDPTKVKDVLLSMSAGNIGFRKAGRGSYDAGYQLAAFVLKQLQERGLMNQIHKVDVVMRGFGAGREAVTKALLGQEGRNLRNKIKTIKDATRLKFGGNRSPKPRRLG